MKNFVKRIGGKLVSRSGDSISEVLVALLISAVSLVMLASMITSSSSLIDKSRDNIEQYYSASSPLAARETPDSHGTVTISDSSSSETVSVDYFINSEHVKGAPVVTYRVTPPTP